MNNITRAQGAVSIKDLEVRQEELREELRQLQKQIDLVKESKGKRQTIIAGIKEYLQWLDQFATWDKENFQDEVSSCFAKLLPPPFGVWSIANGKESSQDNAVDDHQSNAVTFLEDEQPSTADKATGSNALEDDDSKEKDDTFEKYVGSPVQTKPDLDSRNKDGVGEEVAKHLSELPYVEFVTLSPTVGYLRRTDDGAILGAYLGGKNKSLLEVWARCICAEVTQAGGKCGYEVRSAQRLKDIKHEVKFTHISFSVLESLTQIDTSKSPKFRATEKGIEDLEKRSKLSATLSTEDESTPTAQTNDSLTLQVGDRVLVKSDRHGDEFVNMVGVVSAPTKTGAALNVGGQLRYFHSEEFNMVERSAVPRNPADDLSVSTSAPLDLTDDAVPW